MMNRLKDSVEKVSSFAPATCANVAVGFDSLGFAFHAIGDYVTLTKRMDRRITIDAVRSQEPILLDPQKNTAAVALTHLCKALDLDIGFSIEIQKGIPLSSGLGGSAASAVAAVVACNAFLKHPLLLEELAPFALLGEKIASGSAHADNVIPCLFGGLTLIASQQPLQVIRLPLPPIYCVLLHPHLHIATRDARAILSPQVLLADHVQQSASMAAFISALYQGNLSLLKISLQDRLIEPQRSHLIPAFHEMKQAALQHGALGMSLSGSGPTVFAWAITEDDAHQIANAMKQALQKENIQSDCWIDPISAKAAHVLQEN
jgi:homoserine kinase